jgi:co-chaperonin GroES (HSP10)
MIQPLGNRVLIKRLPLPERTEAGIYFGGAYLPNAAKDDESYRVYDPREYPVVGEVLAIGSKVPVRDELSIGDRVVFRWRDAHLDTREIAPDTFLLDYDCCDAGIREVDGKMYVWPLSYVREHVSGRSDR